MWHDLRVRWLVTIVVALCAAVALASIAEAAKRPLTKKQRACLVKSIGLAATNRYAAGKPIPAAQLKKIRRCVPKPAPKPVPPAQPACAPSLGATGAYLSEGPASSADAAANVAAKGTIRATVLFVDFSDGAGTDSPESIVGNWMAPGVAWLANASYGRASVQLNPVLRWIRMPRSADSYGYARGLTFETHRAYVGDAIAAADPSVDFSQTDILYIVAARTGTIGFSPTFRGSAGTFVADGRRLGPTVTFGLDAYNYGRTILPHETDHLFGLPDLYAFAGGHPFVGTWDYMGNVFQPTDLFAWQRLKLGWLDAGQFTCADSGKATDAVLAPLASPGGMKAVFAKTGTTTAVVVENRQPVANDASICDAGALVYTVDSAIASGQGPIVVAGGDVSGNGCGYGNRSDAPLHVGESLTVVGGVTVAVTGGSGDAPRRFGRPRP